MVLHACGAARHAVHPRRAVGRRGVDEAGEGGAAIVEAEGFGPSVRTEPLKPTTPSLELTSDDSIFIANRRQSVVSTAATFVHRFYMRESMKKWHHDVRQGEPRSWNVG